MRRLLEVVSRSANVFRRRKLDRDFEDEFAAHLDLLTARNERRGLARGEARRQAILQLGRLDATRDLHRATRGLRRLDGALETCQDSLRDLIQAAHALAKAPGFTLVCVASLSIGMATVIAIPYFARVLLLPPGGVNTQGLVELLIRPTGSLRSEVGSSASEEWSYGDYVSLRDALAGVSLAGWIAGESAATLENRPQRVTLQTLFVSPNYFSTVGVALARGPGFEGEGATPAVILGHALWRDRFAADPDIIGKALTLNGVVLTVVGVAPEGYCWHVDDCPGIQLFVPLERHPHLQGDRRFDRSTALVRIHGRLQPGVTIDHARAAVTAAMSHLAQQYPVTNSGKSASVEPYFAMGARVRTDVILMQWALLGLATMVLIVVCLNIAGMMQVRSALRERELSIRQAIGAGRARLARYLMSEAVLLAAIAGTLASLLLFGAPQVVSRWLGLGLPDQWLEALRPTPPLIAMAIGLCFVTSLIFGLLPAIRFSRPALIAALRDDAGGGRHRVGRVHRLTAALQVGLAIPFFIVSGAMVDWVRTATTDLGFDTRIAAVRLASDRLDSQDSHISFEHLRDDLVHASGIRAATLADAIPVDFEHRVARASRAGHSDSAFVRPTQVGGRFLETLGIPLLRGRAIGTSDVANAHAIAVISQTAADRLFGREDPIGKELTLELERNSAKVFTVVGVAADFAGRSLDAGEAQVLLPLAGRPAEVFLIARAAQDIQPAALASAFTNVLRNVDPDFTSERMVTGDQLKHRGMEDLLVPSVMVGISGSLVLTLAALGIYGVIGFIVATRTRELAVRVALGASPRRVLGTIQADMVKLVLPGVVGGLSLAMVVVRFVVPWRGLSGAAMEPVVYIIGIAVALTVALLAALPPARRACSVDPMVAMRAQ